MTRANTYQSTKDSMVPDRQAPLVATHAQEQRGHSMGKYASNNMFRTSETSGFKANDSTGFKAGQGAQNQYANNGGTNKFQNGYNQSMHATGMTYNQQHKVSAGNMMANMMSSTHMNYNT